MARLLGAAHDRGDPRAAEQRGCACSGRHDPLDGHPDGIPVDVGIEIDGEDGRIDVDLRDNADCLPLGLNLSEACARAGALIAIYNCLPDDVPHNAGSFRRVEVLIREGSLAGGLTHPHSASVSTTNVLNRLINAIQAGFAQLGAGHGLAEGAGACGAGYAVFSGTDPRSGDAVRQPARDRQQRRPGDAGLRRLGHLRDARLREDGLHRQHRGARAEVPDPLPLAAADRRQRRRRHASAARPASEIVFGPARGHDAGRSTSPTSARNPPAGVLGGGDGSLAAVAKIERRRHADAAADDRRRRAARRASGCAASSPAAAATATRSSAIPRRCSRDVLERWVSREAAREHYGVVLEGRDGELRVDEAATEESRRALRAARGDAGASAAAAGRLPPRDTRPGRRALSGRAMRCAVDTGGTFTDLAIEDRGELSVHKRPTTPANPSPACSTCSRPRRGRRGAHARASCSAGVELFVHGTTRATNAILTGTTARTAFLTTKGHPGHPAVPRGRPRPAVRLTRASTRRPTSRAR